MPPVDSQPPQAPRPIIIAAVVIALGLVGIIGLRVGGYFHGSPEPVAVTAPANPAPITQTAPVAAVPATNLTIAPKPAAPGTPISAGEVLDSIDAWLAKNPNYHAMVETAFPNGAVMGKMDVFTYADGTNGQVLRMKAEMYLPQALQFQAQKKNGKLLVYFPKSDQLIESDTTRMLATMPALAANQSGMKGLLKLARSAFAEASADLRVVTLVLNAEALNLPETSGDIYLSLRTDNTGKLLGAEEQAQGQRVITTLKYLNFDRDLVTREAPVMPAGKVALTTKTLQAAMKEEAQLLISKPLGTKI